MIKKIYVVFLVILFCASVASALDKAELKDVYKEMDIDDVNEIQDSLFKIANDSAANTGYMKSPGLSVGGGGGFFYFFPNASVNDNKPAQADSLSALYGGAGGFLFNLDPHLALGGIFGGMAGATTNKSGNNFYSYSVGAAFEMVHAQYKPIINDSWIIGIDLGLGLTQGNYYTTITDENMNGQDIVRSGSGIGYLVGVDARKRINNMFFWSMKAGCFSTNLGPMKRGTFTDTGKTLNIYAPYLALTLGGNF